MTKARPVFGQPAPRIPDGPPKYGGLPIVQLCTEPSPAITARGWPCHRCLANSAGPGEPIRCHFIERSTAR